MNNPKFKPATDQSVPMNIMVDLITITCQLNSGALSKFNAVKKVINIITEDTGPMLVEILLCFKALIETLSSITQRKKIKEYVLCTRYLQSFF